MQLGLRGRQALIGGLALLLGPAAMAACVGPTPGVLTGVERSYWKEFDAQGRRLLRERGSLRMAGVQLAGQCPSWDWSAQAQWSQGERAYDGQTNTQASFRTHSNLHVQRLSFQAWLPMHEHWALGMQATHARIDRDIAGQGNVLGYPERFSYWQASLGARYQGRWSDQLRWSTSGWLGAGPAGRMQLDLPRYDPITLPLGASRTVALSLDVAGGAHPQQPGWSWRGGLSYRFERTAAGPARALTRNGIPAGVVLQPRFEQQHWGAHVGASYRF